MITVSLILMTGCLKETPNDAFVPHEERWGIYSLDLATKELELIYSSSRKVSNLRLNNFGDTFVFSQMIDGNSNEHEEICTLQITGSNFKRLTDNTFWDIYPSWSPDDSKIFFVGEWWE